MTRSRWLWLVVAITGAALAATFLFETREETAREPGGPRPTPFGWIAQLGLEAGEGMRGLREGPAAQARFADPYGIAVDAQGNRYVADAGDNNRIRRIGSDGAVTTWAGSEEGFVDGVGIAARFHTPSGLALDEEGNLYVADTGNHAIRKIDAQGMVSTVAGTGEPGLRDGPAMQARFNGPLGVAVDRAGNLYVADTYNDRIRKIGRDGNVSTLAGAASPGYQDGVGEAARFDTPAGVAVDALGNVWVADMRNNAIRKLAIDGLVTTLLQMAPGDSNYALHRPLAIAVTRDGMLYASTMSCGCVVQISRGGGLHVLSGDNRATRLSRPAGLALDARGNLHVADAGSRRIYRLAPLAAGVAEPLPSVVGPSPLEALPQTGGRWPLHPQLGWHEVVGTLGEVRGDYDGESRHHLHGGLDIRGDVGQEVLAIADGKVSSPSAAWGLGQLGEGLSLDDVGYIHMRVGRTPQQVLLDPERFQLLRDEAGEPERVRVRRGTRFKAGEALGTINRMAHVHLSVGASGFERNAVALGLANYADHFVPRIAGIELLDALEQPLTEKQDGRVLIPRELEAVQVVVDAWDQVDRNLPRRRLGLHALGYQLLHDDGTPVAGYEAPRMNIEFNRLPADDAVKVAYAPGSGITVHGSAMTHFKYFVTNTVRDGEWATGALQTTDLPPGDYVLRITAKDYVGNTASAGRDLKLRLLAGKSE